MKTKLRKGLLLIAICLTSVKNKVKLVSEYKKFVLEQVKEQIKTSIAIGDMSLSERTYNCSNCNFVCDRDINASINIRTEGYSGINVCGQLASI